MEINNIQFEQIKDTQFFVSRCGQVYTAYKKRICKQHDNNGYKMVWMQTKWNYIHRIVAQQFIPNQLNKKWVNHKDGNKANNAVENLEWSTISENIKHAFATGLKKRISGKDHWRHGSKLPEEIKKKMSVEKIGEKHPKFKGYYITPAGRFASAQAAATANKISSHTVINRCKKENPYTGLGWNFEAKLT